MLSNCTTLKNSGVQSWNAGKMVDIYRLLLCLDGSYKVHVERRESYGAVSECFLYEGNSLEQANWVFNKYSN